MSIFDNVTFMNEYTNPEEYNRHKEEEEKNRERAKRENDSRQDNRKMYAGNKYLTPKDARFRKMDMSNTDRRGDGNRVSRTVTRELEKRAYDPSDRKAYEYGINHQGDITGAVVRNRKKEEKRKKYEEKQKEKRLNEFTNIFESIELV